MVIIKQKFTVETQKKSREGHRNIFYGNHHVTKEDSKREEKEQGNYKAAREQLIRRH